MLICGGETREWNFQNVRAYVDLVYTSKYLWLFPKNPSREHDDRSGR